MKTRLVQGLFGVLLIWAGSAPAVPISLHGFLNDPANGALVASDLSAPLFGDDFEISNNVALYAFNVGTAGLVTFESVGFAAGGVDPYFTLFQGPDTSATFLESNFLHAFSVGGDFSLSLVLPSDTYMIAISAFANMSFAENTGSGTLADGFIGFGQPDLLGSYYYELLVTTGPSPIPEPAVVVLFAMGLLILLGYRSQVAAL